MSGTRNSRAFSNVQLESLRFQRTAIPAAGGVMAVDGDGSVAVTSNVSLGTLSVTGHASFNTVTSDLEIVNRLRANGATITNLAATNATLSGGLTASGSLSVGGSLTVGATATIPTIIVKNIAITDLLVLPTTIAQPVGTTVICAPQILAGTTNNVPFLSRYALDVSGSAQISKGLTVSELTVTNQINLPVDIAIDNLLVADIYGKRILAGSEIPVPNPYALNVVGKAVFEEGVTMYGNLDAVGITVNMLTGITANIGTLNITNIGNMQSLVVNTTTQTGALGVTGQATVGLLSVTTGATVNTLRALSTMSLPGGITLDSTGLIQAPSALVQNFEVTNQFIVGSSAHVVIPTSYHRAVLANKIIAGTTYGGALLTDNYAMDVSGALLVTQGATVSGLLVAAGGLTATTGYFSDTVTVARGIAGTTATLSGNATIGGGLTVSGLLAAAGGLTTTTGYFSDTVTVARGIAGTTATLSGNATIGGGLTVSGRFVGSAGLTTTSGYFSDTVTVARGIAGTTANLTGNVTLGTGLSVNTIGPVSGRSIYYSVSDGRIVFENSDSDLSISAETQLGGRVASYSSAFTNGVGVNAYFNGAGFTMMRPNLSGMFFSTGDATRTSLRLVRNDTRVATSFMTFDTYNNRLGVMNGSPAETLDIIGTMKVSSNAVIGGGLTVTGRAIFSSGISTNTIQSQSGTQLTLQPTGANVGIIFGNDANKTSGAVISYPLLSMYNGAYVSGQYGIQIAQTTGAIITPAGGTGMAIGYNSVESTSGNMEVVVGRGGYANGGGFNIWNTTNATGTTANSKIFQLSNSGSLNLAGGLAVSNSRFNVDATTGWVDIYPPGVTSGTVFGTYASSGIQLRGGISGGTTANMWIFRNYIQLQPDDLGTAGVTVNATVGVIGLANQNGGFRAPFMVFDGSANKLRFIQNSSSASVTIDNTSVLEPLPLNQSPHVGRINAAQLQVSEFVGVNVYNNNSGFQPIQPVGMVSQFGGACLLNSPTGGAFPFNSAATTNRYPTIVTAWKPTASTPTSLNYNILTMDASNGIIGIRNTTPAATLDVSGTMNVSGTLTTGALALTGPIIAIQSGSPSRIGAPYYAWRYTLNSSNLQFQSEYASIQLWKDAWSGPASNNFATNGYVPPISGYYLLTATVRLADNSAISGIFFGNPITTTSPPNGNVSYSSQGIDGTNVNSAVTINNAITGATNSTLTFMSTDGDGRRTASMSQIVLLLVTDRVTISFVNPSKGAVNIIGATFSGHLVYAL